MAHALRGGAARAWGGDDADGAVPTLTFGAPAPAAAAAPPALAGPGGHAMTRRSGGKEKAAKAKAAKAATFEDGAVPDLVLTPGHVGGEHTSHHQFAGSTLFTDWLSGAEVSPLEGGEEFAVPDLARRAPAGGAGGGGRGRGDVRHGVRDPGLPRGAAVRPDAAERPRPQPRHPRRAARGRRPLLRPLQGRLPGPRRGRPPLPGRPARGARPRRRRRPPAD